MIRQKIGGKFEFKFRARALKSKRFFRESKLGKKKKNDHNPPQQRHIFEIIQKSLTRMIERVGADPVIYCLILMIAWTAVDKGQSALDVAAAAAILTVLWSGMKVSGAYLKVWRAKRNLDKLRSERWEKLRDGYEDRDEVPSDKLKKKIKGPVDDGENNGGR